MDLGIEGRVGLVTGASKGIGRAIAAELISEGGRVAISSRSRAAIESTASAIGAHAFVHDSADLDAAPELVGAVEQQLGPIEILVTNTGGPPAGPDALGFEHAEWERAYRTLVLAPMTLIGCVVAGMRERSWGRIVNVASSTVREPAPALMLSNSHRSATVAAFKTLARQLAPDGITLNSVLPGRIATDRLFELLGSREAAEQLATHDVPLGRLGSVEEFAAAATFLCSERASYITGASVLIDGGLTHSV